MKKNQKQEKTLMQCMETIVEMAEDSHFEDLFWESVRSEVKIVTERLGITPMQAALLAICLQCGPRNVDFNDIAHFLDVKQIRVLNYNDDLKALVHAKYLKYHDAKEQNSFDVPRLVVRSFMNNEVPEQPVLKDLDNCALFAVLNELFSELYDESILAIDAREELDKLFADNKQNDFVHRLSSLKSICKNDHMLLVLLCHLLINKDDDRVSYNQISDIYTKDEFFNTAKSQFREGTHYLMVKGLVEHVCDEGQVDTSHIHLTADACRMLLPDYKIKGDGSSDLIKPESLIEKKLFYTQTNASQVQELESFLADDRFNEIRNRMKENGYRQGFACLFYGAPGTGKTETVNQLARMTGRSILAINVPDIKSKWVGESEKNIKAAFDRYRFLVKQLDKAPILLFNEADAIIGIRREGATSAVDKMENSIQNIILQEMETLDGIMIATTNLTQNLDPAFERRFLYKICFDKPDAQVRKQIWQQMIPALSDQDYSVLADKYDFSGGQMENVARKYSINTILYGNPEDKLSVITSYCDSEKLEKSVRRAVGF